MPNRRASNLGSNSSKSSGKIARMRDKALRLRERIKQSDMAFFRRRDERLAWWQSAFRTPLVGYYGWVFSRASSLWAAFMTLLGFSSQPVTATSASRSKAVRRGVVRTAMCEGLEPRQLMAVVGYVDDRNPGSTGDGAYIANAGHTPVQLTDASLTPATLNTLDALIVGTSTPGAPAGLQAVWPNVEAWVNAGGRLIVHEGATGSSPAFDLMPAQASVVFGAFPSSGPNLDPALPAHPIHSGAFGTIVATTLDGGNQAFQRTISVASLDPGTKVVLSPDGAPADAASVEYIFGAGRVVYTSISAEFYTGGGGIEPFRSNLINIYLRNELDFLVPAGATLHADLNAAGDLTISDSSAAGKANAITVSKVGTDIVITDATEQFATPLPGVGATLSNGGKTLTIPAAKVTGKLIVNTGADSDLVTVDLANGPLPTGGLEYDGGLGATDKLKVTGGTFTNATHNYTDANSGNLKYDALPNISYKGLEPVDMTGSTVTNLVLNLPAAGSIATLGDDGVLANAILRFSSSPVTFETTDFTVPSGSLTINRGNATDIITVTAITDFNAAAALNIGSIGLPVATTNFAGKATVDSLNVFATTVANTGAADLTVTKIATLNAGAGGANLGNQIGDKMSFGSLAVNSAGVVNIAQDSQLTANAVTGTDVTLTAVSGNLSLGVVTATTGNVTLGAQSGSILDSGSATNLVTGKLVTLAAAVDIGSAPPISNINTKADTIVASANSNSGGTHGIWINEFDSVALQNVTTVNGLIRVVTGGTTDVVNVAAGDGAAATLRPAVITASSGNINVTKISSANGNVSLSATSGAINPVGGATHVTGSGAASLVTLIAPGGIGSVGNPVIFSTPNNQAGVNVATNSVNANQFVSAVGKANISTNDMVSGAGTVNLNGGQFFTLAGGNDVTGNVIVGSGATLAGTGTVTGTATANAGGTVAPGLSPGIINTGSLTLNGSSTLNIEVNGPGAVAGTDYDQVNVTGSVTLSGATLNVTSNGNPVAPFGSVLTIINNDGGDAVTGTFAGLPEGGSVVVGGNIFTISYVGGSGNDVTLKSLAITIDANDTPPQEAVTNGQFSVFLSAPVASNTVVEFTVTGGAVAAPGPGGAPGNPNDYLTISPTSVTILAGQTEALINVIVFDDLVAEDTALERVEITLNKVNGVNLPAPGGFPAPGPGTAPAGQLRDVVTIIDNDAPQITIAAAPNINPLLDNSINPENSADTGRFLVSLRANGLPTASATPTVVLLTIPQPAPTSRASFSDWTSNVVGGTLSTATAQTFNITSRRLDTNVAALTTSVNHGLIVGQTVVVQNIDGNFNGTFVVTSIPAPNQFTYNKTNADIAVTNATINNAVVTLSNSRLTINAGVTEVSITVAATPDTIVEDNETIDITLSNISSGLATIGAASTATVNIVDDDAANVTLEPNPTSDLTGNDPDTLPPVDFPGVGAFPSTEDGRFIVQLSDSITKLPTTSSQNTVIGYTVTTPPTAATANQIFSTDFAAAPAAISIVAGAVGTASVTGGELILRRTTNAGPMLSPNLATLTVDLSSIKTAGGAFLQFDHARISNNETVDNLITLPAAAANPFTALGAPPAQVTPFNQSVTGIPDYDGVAISADGITWYNLFNFGSNTAYQTQTINLERFLYQHNLQPGPNYRIRFSQFDAQLGTNNVADAGRKFDNVRVLIGDYDILSGVVTVPAGSTTAAINVNVLNDLMVEGDENVTVTLNTVPSSADPSISIDPFLGNRQQNTVIGDSDTATATLAVGLNGNEFGPINGRFNVNLTNPIGLPMRASTDTTITFELVPPPTAVATFGTDYTFGGANVTFNPGTNKGTMKILAGETQGFITVNVLSDIDVEDDEFVRIQLLNTVADPVVGDPQISVSTAPVALAIQDEDAALIRLNTVTDGSEPGNKGIFLVDLVRTVDFTNTFLPVTPVKSNVDTVITYAVSGLSTASAGTDYVTLSGTVTITAGQSFAFIDVNVLDDLFLEPAETVTVTLTSKIAGDASTIVHPSQNTDTVKILDNDTLTVKAIPVNNGTEGPANVVGPDATDGKFNLVLDGNPAALAQYTGAAAGNIVVVYAMSGLASNGIDYQTLSGTATIAAGQTSTTVNVDVINDSFFDPNETVTLKLVAVSSQPAVGLAGAGVIVDSTDATLTIADDEAGGVTISAIVDARESNTNGEVTFSLPAPSPFNTVVTYAVTPSGAAPIATQTIDHNFFSGTVTFVAGETTKKVVVPVLNDTVKEDIEIIPVQITGFAPGGNGGGFTFDPSVKNVRILQDQTVDVSNLVNGREGALANTVTNRVLTGNIATITTASPHNYIPGQTVTLAGVNNGVFNGTFVIQDTPSSTTFRFVRFNANIGTATSPGTITPNSPSFTIGMQSPSTANTVVTYQILPAAGDAVDGIDFATLSPFTATIAAGQTTTNVTLSVIDDLLVENTENLTIKLLGVTNVADPDITIGVAAPNPSTFETLNIAVTQKSLTGGAGGVATLTTSRPHGFVVGQTVVVSGVDANFDGQRTITHVSGTTFSFGSTAGALAPVATGGTVSRLGTVATKSLTGNVATLTTAGPHGFFVGETIVVALTPADPVFDGTFVINAVTANTISYIKINADVAATPSGGSVVIEAGNLPTIAQLTSGTSGLSTISGKLASGADQDMYLIRIDNPAAFSASTVGGATFDTQLFLFDASGKGIVSNDDAVGLQSTIGVPLSNLVPAPGLYYLAISGFNADPTSNGNTMWLSDTNIAPNGAGALGSVNGWTAGGSFGDYAITLTGASFATFDTKATLSIFDNDAGFIQVTGTNGKEGISNLLFNITQSSVSSTDTVVTYTLDTVGSPTTPASINLNFATPAGTNGDHTFDYSAKTTYTATIAAGQTSVSVTVPVIDDLIVESDTETVVLTVNNIISGDPDIKLGTVNGPTLNFQQGALVGGNVYAGTADTYISQVNQAVSFGTAILISVDTDDTNVFASLAALNGLIRFDNIIGAGLIPANSKITNAVLSFAVIPGSSAVNLHQALIPWDPNGTWQTLFGGNGIQANGAEAAITPVNGTTPLTNNFNVTSTVQLWANGTANNGWAILPTSTSDWDAGSSEQPLLANRPMLSITVAPSASVVIEDNDAALLSISTTVNGKEPGGALVTAAVSFKAASGTTATLTTSSAHGFVPGDTVVVAIGDPIFDGTFILDAGTGGSSLVYTKGNSTNVATFPTIGRVARGIGGVNAGRAIVSIDKVSTSNTVVSYTITDGTANGAGVDYLAPTATQTITIPAGQTSATIFIEVADDFTVEGPEDVTVTLQAINYLSGSTTIVDDTDPQITFGTKTNKVVIDDNDVGLLSVTSANGSENNPIPVNITNKVLTNNVVTLTTNVAHTFTPGESVLVSIGDPIFDGEYIVTAFPGPTATAFSYIKANTDIPSTAVAAGTAANQPFDGKFLISTLFASNTATVIPYQITVAGPSDATQGTDYLLKSGPTTLTGTVTLPAFLTSVEITIDVIEDSINEGDENVTLKLLPPTGRLSLGAPDTAAAKIIDDDKLVVSVVATDNEVTEGADAGVNDGLHTVKLSFASDSDVVVVYTVGGTATPGSPQSPQYTNGNDYVPLPGSGSTSVKTIVVPAGTTEFKLPVEAYQDFFDEADETVVVTLNSFQTVLPSTATVSNNQTDALLGLPVFGPTVDVVTIKDEVFDITIARTDSPAFEPGLGLGGSNGQFTIFVANDLTDPLIVVVEDVTPVAVGKAILGTDYSYTGSTNKLQTVTIQPGQTTAKLTVTVIDDNLSEGNETVDVKINTFFYGKVLGSLQIGTPSTAVETIFDNDQLNVFITTKEGKDKLGGTPGDVVDGEIIFNLGAVSQHDTVITYAVEPAPGTTATAGVDYVAIPAGTLTIGAGKQTISIPLNVLNDTDVEGDEFVQLKITSAVSTGPNGVTGTGNLGSAKIVDEDKATVKITGTSNASEPSGLGFFTIEQSAKSSTDTIVSYSVSGGTATQVTDYTQAPTAGGTAGKVTIVAGQTQAFVTVTVLDDNIVEANPETVQFSLAGAPDASDPDITVNAGQQLSTINIGDDDVAQISIVKTQDGKEGGANGIFTVRMVDAANGTSPKSSDVPVVLTYQISGTAKGGGSNTNVVNGPDYLELATGTIGSLTFAPGQTSATLDINIFDDSFVENLETVTLREISVTTPTTTRAITPSTPTATVTTKFASNTLVVLTTAANHGFQPGQSVVVNIGDPVFDGTFLLDAGTGGSTLVYTKSNNTSVGSTASGGTVALTAAVANVSFKQLTFNTVNLFTSANHNMVPGQVVVVNIGDPVFDGTFVLGAGTGGTTLVYAKASADVGFIAAAGTVASVANATVNIEDNDKSTLSINGGTFNEGNRIFDLAGPTLTLTLSSPFDVETKWQVNYAVQTATAISKLLTNNVATLTTMAAHGFAVGQPITVALSPADPVFDGLYLVTSVPNATSFTYAKTNPDLAVLPTGGTITILNGATGGPGDNLLGSDYDSTPDVVTFPAGSTTQTFKVDFNEEDPNVPGGNPQTNLVEANEKFVTAVSPITSLAGYSFDSSTKSEVTITNDDTATYKINDDAVVDEENPVTLALGAGIKSLTGNVATLTTGAHGLTVGTTVVVALTPADPLFDGRYVVASATTLSTLKVNADVAAAGYAAISLTTFPQTTLTFTVSVDNPVDMPIKLFVDYVDDAGVLGAIGKSYKVQLPIPAGLGQPLPAGTDYDNDQDSMTAPAFFTGNVGTVTVSVNADTIVEGGTANNPGFETFTSKSSIDPSSFALIPQLGRLFNNVDTGKGTINDKLVATPDTAQVSISVVDGFGAETVLPPANDAQFKVSQTQPSSVDTVVKFNVAVGGTNATQNSDYQLKVGAAILTNTVTIPAGQTEVLMDIKVLNDGLLEVDEFVTVTLDSITSSDPNISLVVGPSFLTATAQIDDNNTALLKVAKSKDGAEPGNAANDGEFIFTLSQLSASDTIITYRVLNPNVPADVPLGAQGPYATPGAAVPIQFGDYVALSGTVTIPANTLSAKVLVDVVNDAIPEGTERVSIYIQSFVGNADIAIDPSSRAATVDILEDGDGLFIKVEKIKDGSEPGTGPDDGQFRVMLVDSKGAPVVVPFGSTFGNGGITVNFLLGGTASSPTDYSNISSALIAEGASTGLVTIDVQDDLVVEGTETVILTLVGNFPTQISTTGEPVGIIPAPLNVAQLNILDNDLPTASVVGRSVFYNGSSWDNNGIAVGVDDFAAIATNKTPLLAGQTATFANYTSYAKGINGIVVDIASLASIPTFPTIGNYFQFRVGNNSTPASWLPAPSPNSITVLPGQGVGGSTRVMLTWADNAIQKQWLQVITLANANTGLTTRDVHYWGNAIGESGTPNVGATLAPVDSTDVLGANNNQSGFVLQPITNIYDYNRDKRVDSTDVLLANSNQSGFSSLVLFTAPASGSGGEGEGGSGLIQSNLLSAVAPMVENSLIGTRIRSLSAGEVYGPVQSNNESEEPAGGSLLSNIVAINGPATIDDMAKNVENKADDSMQVYSSLVDSLLEDDDAMFGL